MCVCVSDDSACLTCSFTANMVIGGGLVGLFSCWEFVGRVFALLFLLTAFCFFLGAFLGPDWSCKWREDLGVPWFGQSSQTVDGGNPLRTTNPGMMITPANINKQRFPRALFLVQDFVHPLYYWLVCEMLGLHVVQYQKRLGGMDSGMLARLAADAFIFGDEPDKYTAKTHSTGWRNVDVPLQASH